MRNRVILVLLLTCGLSIAGHAQDIQLNQPDHNASNLDNNTTNSELNHAAGPGAIIAAWNDSNQIASMGFAFDSLMGWAYSTTGGASFVDAGIALPPPSGWQNFGDPAVATDGAGNYYMAALASSTGGLPNGMLIAQTTSLTPPTFGTPLLLSPSAAGNDLDKEFIAVDRSGGPFNGRVYLATSEGDFFAPAVGITVSHSTTTMPLAMSPLQAITPFADLHHGAMPAVGPSGEVYVVFGRFLWSGFGITGVTIQILKSTDGGVTFVNPATATTTPLDIATPAITPDTLGSGAASTRTRGFPYIAVDNTPSGSGTRGNVYVVFQADPDGAGGDKSSIFFTRSTDGGATWMTPKNINNGPTVTCNADGTTNDNWQPAIAVSPVNGHIYVTFYDRRNDVGNTTARMYFARSTDGGLTWTNDPVTATSFVPSTGYDSLAGGYFGDYNWADADATALHFTWGDSRNPCTPPGGAPNPCSPSGRGDQDAFYRQRANLTGPDPFIQPWGYTTGVGPLWQTPDVFVRDAGGTIVNAQKTIVNRLFARVRNLGDAAANGVVVRFKYAPWYAGLNDSMLKEIAAPSINLGAAGSGTDVMEVEVPWDLTNPAENNGGIWPVTVGDPTVTHFCVKVWVEFPSDVNGCNDVAQNNFVDVMDAPAGGGMSAISFLIAAPERELRRPLRFRVNRLPAGFAANISVKGISSTKLWEGFRLKPGELRVATVRFVRRPGYKSNKDVIADISLAEGNVLLGGISARLYNSRTTDVWQSAVRGDDKRVRVVERREPPKANPDERRPPEPKAPSRVIPELVKYRRVFRAPYERVIEAVVATLRAQGTPVALLDRERGLVNTKPVQLSARLFRVLVVREQQRKAQNGGRWMASFYLRPVDGGTEVGVYTLLIADAPLESPFGGTRVLSNGTLEKQLLEAIAKRVE